MRKRTILIAALTLCTLGVSTLTPSAFAADNPWYGTWKLNRAKSTLTGTTYTVVKTGNVYNFDYGALKFKLADDGKDYPIMPTRTSSLKKTGNNEWLLVAKVNGVENARTVLKLSSDGKTISDSTTGTHADGTTFKSESTSERVSGGPDIAGTWKDVKESSTAPSIMMYADGGAGKLKVDDPISKASGVYGLDGKAEHGTGPRAVPDMTTSFKKISGTELKYVVYVKEKPYYEGIQTVSADGKVLKDVSWLTVKPNEKTIEIYDKQ